VLKSEEVRNKIFQIVDGGIEVIEVKTGKLEFKEKQLKSYRRIIKAGHRFRLIYVYIESLDENRFTVVDILVEDPDELPKLGKMKGAIWTRSDRDSLRQRPTKRTT